MKTLISKRRPVESKKPRGRLNIYLGAYPGAGKTYAMLEDGINMKSKGYDVKIGLIETHDRNGVHKLLTKLDSIPLKDYVYRNVTFKVLNLSEIIKQKPQFILVDELAHKNLPKQDNLFRYLDIMDILNEGINVYTTINIQNINIPLLDNIIQDYHKKNDIVPEFILQAADNIIFVDTAVNEVFARLWRGDIVSKEMLAQAISRYYKIGLLKSLRNITIHYINNHLPKNKSVCLYQKYRTEERTESLAVLLLDDSFYKELIFYAEELCFALGCNLVILLSEKLNKLSKNSIECYAKNSNVRIIRVCADSLMAVQEKIPASLHINQCVIHPRYHQTNRVKKLFNNNANGWVFHFLPIKKVKLRKYYVNILSSINHWLLPVLLIFCFSIVFHQAKLIHANIIHLFVSLMLISVSFLCRPRLAATTAFVSAVYIDYWLLSPIYSLNISSLIGALTYFTICFMPFLFRFLDKHVKTYLTNKNQKLATREQVEKFLMSTNHSINYDLNIKKICKQIEEIFEINVAIFIKPENKLYVASKTNIQSETQAALRWALLHKKKCGYGTSIFSDLNWHIIPFRYLGCEFGLVCIEAKNNPKILFSPYYPLFLQVVKKVAKQLSRLGYRNSLLNFP